MQASPKPPAGRLPSRRAAASRVLGVALAAALAIARSAAADPSLSVVEGTVEVGRGEPPVWRSARVGDQLGAGDAVRTGPGARAEVALGTGTVRLYESSLLRLPPDATRPEGPAAVGLERGSSLFEVSKRRPGDPFEVRTPEVVASVKGTQFGVALSRDAAAVSVYSGLVGVRSPAAKLANEVLVRPGFSAIGGSGRPFDLSLSPRVDAWGGWSKGVPVPAPPAPAAGGSPSAAADDVKAARAAALKASAPEVMGQVVERRPELAKEADAAGAIVPAALDTDGVAVGAEAAAPPIDAITDPAKQDLTRDQQEKLAEAVLNGRLANTVFTTGSGGVTTLPGGGAGAPPSGTTAPGYTIDVVKSGGPNRVVISDPAGQAIADLTPQQLKQVVSTGDASTLPPSLLTVLSSTGANGVQFAQQALGLLK